VTRVFWIDHGYDRERAATDVGRYAAHVAANPDAFADTYGDISPVGFACVAWDLATAPSLSPGYVRTHRRVLEAACVRNGYDGGLGCRVSLVAPWPAELSANRAWGHDQGWRDWPLVLGQYVAPPDRDTARVPHARATLLVEAPLPLDGLPESPESPDDGIAEAATRAVTILVRELNSLLAPMVRQLEPA
jgi:hypothetical protein